MTIETLQGFPLDISTIRKSCLFIETNTTKQKPLKLYAPLTVNNIKIEKTSKILLKSLQYANLSSRLLSTPLIWRASLWISSKFAHPGANSTISSKLVRKFTIFQSTFSAPLNLSVSEHLLEIFPYLTLLDHTHLKWVTTSFLECPSACKIIYKNILLIKQLCNLISSVQSS